MNSGNDAITRLTLDPIGIVRSTLAAKVDAARQPRAAAGTRGKIELFPGRNFEHALDDLGGWDYIWVIYWFHLNASWRPKVLPPRSSSGRKGVFSTRSPHRPGPIGLSAVRLERIEGLTLHVRDVDMVDGTPVLDIKPYVPYTDAHPGARSGWLEDAARGTGGTAPADPVDPYSVTFSPLAAEQAAWIEQRTSLALGERIRATLSLGPQPHPYRRIRREGEGLRLAIKDWRVRFTVSRCDVHVASIYSGYRLTQLAAGVDERFTAHREFLAAWADSGPASPQSTGSA